MPAVRVAGDATADISAPVTRVLAATGAVIDGAASAGSSTVDDVMDRDDSLVLDDSIVVPVARASAPVTTAAIQVPLGAVQALINTLGQSSRHLQYVTDNHVKCTMCTVDIYAGGESRGSLKSRLETHCVSATHVKRLRTVAGMSAMSSFFPSAATAAQPGTACGDVHDRAYQRAADKVLNESFVFCTGLPLTQYEYKREDGSVFSADPMVLFDDIEDPERPPPPWVALNSFLSQPERHLRDRDCARQPYYAASVQQIADGTAEFVCRGCLKLPKTDAMRGRLRRIEDRRVEGGTERGERTLGSTCGYPTLTEMRSALLVKQARIVELKRRLRYIDSKPTDKLEWLMRLSKKASAEVSACALLLLSFSAFILYFLYIHV